MSRKTASEDFNHPETQDYIQKLLLPHDQRLERLVDNSISAVELSLGALRDDAADHAVRMRAVEQTRKLLELRAGRKDGNSDGKPLRFSGELVELLALYAKFQAD